MKCGTACFQDDYLLKFIEKHGGKLLACQGASISSH